MGLQVIHQIYTQATGDTRRLNTNCNHCILSLVRDCGRLYMADKKELYEKNYDMTKVVTETKIVGEMVVSKEMSHLEKVVVKTRKPRTGKTAK